MSSPSLGKTPEAAQSGLRRKDSKHALTTCHGTTTNGRACRRPLAAGDSAGSPRYTIRGTVLIPNNDQDPAVFFCWQHKDQAAGLSGADVDAVEVEGRMSLETVFRNLGLEEIGEEEEVRFQARRAERDLRQRVSTNANGHNSSGGFEKRPRRKPSTQPGSGIFASLFGCFTDSSQSVKTSRRTHEHDTQRSERRGEKVGLKSEIRSPEDHIYPEEAPRIRQSPPRHRDSHRSSQEGRYAPQTTGDYHGSPTRKSPSDRRRSSNERVTNAKRRSSTANESQKTRTSVSSLKIYRDKQSPQLIPPTTTHRSTHSQPNIRTALAPKPTNQRAHSAPSKAPQDWLPALPAGADDATRIRYAKLLTAMSEPPTARDDAPGYIYMFWHADKAQTAAERDAAASLVGGTAGRPEEEVLRRRFFRGEGSGAEKRTLLLKIGRAANVHQRLGQWRRQCGYNVSLLKYYPQGDADAERAKARHVGKIEKLVHLHLEMLGKRVRRECRCGTEHREYFEIDATTAAVRDVDEVIRRWVEWGDRRFGAE